MDYAKIKAEQIKTNDVIQELKEEQEEEIKKLEEKHNQEVKELENIITETKDEFLDRFAGYKKFAADQIKEIKESNSEKFKELYSARNKTEVCLAELTSTVKMLVQNMDKQFTTIEKKIDELAERVKG